MGIFISALLVIDSFLASYYVGFHSRSVSVIDPTLKPIEQPSRPAAEKEKSTEKFLPEATPHAVAKPNKSTTAKTATPLPPKTGTAARKQPQTSTSRKSTTAKSGERSTSKSLKQHLNASTKAVPSKAKSIEKSPPQNGKKVPVSHAPPVNKP